MEVQQPFRYKQGLVFDFSGDDDIWVFINKKLVLDMGGVHSPLDGGFNLDAEAGRLGLQVGRTYTISVFWAERHITGSNCRITTNIFMPNQLFLETIGNDTLTAGVPKQVLKALLVDENGDPLPDSVAEAVTWQIVSGQPGDSIMNPGKQGQIPTVQATMAWRSITVTAEYRNPAMPVPVRATRQIWVQPAAANHIVIEALTNDTGVTDLNHDKPLPSAIVMTLSDLVGKAHAVLRDQYGNFVSKGTGVTWAVADQNKARVAPAAGKPWIGEITRPGTLDITMDSTIVTASQAGLLPGSARVHIYYQMPCAMPVATPDGESHITDRFPLHSPRRPRARPFIIAWDVMIQVWAPCTPLERLLSYQRQYRHAQGDSGKRSGRVCAQPGNDRGIYKRRSQWPRHQGALFYLGSMPGGKYRQEQLPLISMLINW